MSQEHSIHEVTTNKTVSIWPFFAIALVLILLFFAVNKWLLGGAASDPNPEDAARNELRVKNLAELRKENDAKLHTYAWVDRAKGSVQIPIQQAMAAVIPQLNANGPRPAYPVAAVPAPAAPSAASPAPSSAPAASPAASPAPARP